MSDLRQATIDTYNNSAEKFAEYFRGIGSRVEDVERGLTLAGAEDRTARVVELGCGNGRDAVEIVKRVGFFEGVDNSYGMIELARKTVPSGNFRIEDMVEYKFPKRLDIIFAFASLLHLDRDEVRTVLRKSQDALRPGGIFYISSKLKPEFQTEVQKDQFGERKFFYYNPTLIKRLGGTAFSSAYESRQTIGTTDWFTLALKRADK